MFQDSHNDFQQVAMRDCEKVGFQQGKRLSIVDGVWRKIVRYTAVLHVHSKEDSKKVEF